MRTLDYETEGWDDDVNPLVHPPKPIGLAIKEIHHEPYYVTEWEEMRREWISALGNGDSLVFHNAPFDIAVGTYWFGTHEPHWATVHDTQYLLYLADPHAPNLSLKPSAQRLLNTTTDGQDRLKDWILLNVPEARKSNWGRYICRAPVELVSFYAKQDVFFTEALFCKLYEEYGGEAYDLERRLRGPLERATRRGIRVHRAALQRAHGAAQAAQAQCEHRIATLLRSPGLNPHSGAELAAALDKEDQVTSWVKTPTGKKSTAKKNLLGAIKDPELLQLLLYTSAMQTCIGTFMEPWLAKSASSGRLHPNWNQVRSHEGKGRGTRTGRLSSDNPNFQNVPNEFNFDVPEGLPPMPRMRDYLLPEEGCVWLSRDFSAQEMRILAHFERGELCAAFVADPDTDPHRLVQRLILETTGEELTRKQVKIIGFGMLYGMGVGSLARDLGVDRRKAAGLISLYHQALPGIKTLQEETKKRGQGRGPAGREDHIITWGGRKYRAEEPKIVNGSWRSYEYKLLNYLIQGSAADQTKRALNRLFTSEIGDSFLATVHDEINISAPVDRLDGYDVILRSCMNDGEGWTVPMRSTRAVGETWGSIK